MPIKSFLTGSSLRRGRSGRGKAIAPHVVISKPESWSSRVLLASVMAVLAMSLGIGLFFAGQYSAGYAVLQSNSRIRDLAQENSQLRTQVKGLSDSLAATATQLHIEQGARQSMESQLSKLEEERDRLTRDLTLFENLFPSNESSDQPNIRGFRIEPASTANPDEWRYRLLIMRPGNHPKDFVGEMQLETRYQANGKVVQANSRESGQVRETLKFDRYQRMEGHFKTPPGTKLLGALVRVVENGRPIAESTYQP